MDTLAFELIQKIALSLASHSDTLIASRSLASLAKTSRRFRHIVADNRVWYRVYVVSVLRRSPASITFAATVDYRLLVVAATGRDLMNSVCGIYKLEHPQLLTSLTKAGLTARDFGRYQEAESLLQSAHELTTVKYQQAPSSNEFARDFADSLFNLSLVKGNQGKLCGDTGAKALRERAISLYKRTLDPCSEIVANAVYALADIHYVLREFHAAKELYQEALETRKRLFAPVSEELAQSYVGLGLVFDGLADHTEAEQYYKQALEIREALHGPHHPKVARVLVNLGALYKAKGRLDQTVNCYIRALSIREATMGVDHPFTVRLRQNLNKTLDALNPPAPTAESIVIAPVLPVVEAPPILAPSVAPVPSTETTVFVPTEREFVTKPRSRSYTRAAFIVAHGDDSHYFTSYSQEDGCSVQ